MYKATRKQSTSLSVVTMFFSGIMMASAAYGQKTSKDTRASRKQSSTR